MLLDVSAILNSSCPDWNLERLAYCYFWKRNAEIWRDITKIWTPMWMLIVKKIEVGINQMGKKCKNLESLDPTRLCYGLSGSKHHLYGTWCLKFVTSYSCPTSNSWNYNIYQNSGVYYVYWWDSMQILSETLCPILITQAHILICARLWHIQMFIPYVVFHFSNRNWLTSSYYVVYLVLSSSRSL